MKAATRVCILQPHRFRLISACPISVSGPSVRTHSSTNISIRVIPCREQHIMQVHLLVQTVPMISPPSLRDTSESTVFLCLPHKRIRSHRTSVLLYTYAPFQLLFPVRTYHSEIRHWRYKPNPPQRLVFARFFTAGGGSYHSISDLELCRGPRATRISCACSRVRHSVMLVGR
jgi:hypothetical protein